MNAKPTMNAASRKTLVAAIAVLCAAAALAILATATPSGGDRPGAGASSLDTSPLGR